MAAAPSSSPAALAAATRRPSGRFSMIVLALLMGLYGPVLFGVDNLLLELAREGWNKIQLIEGSFSPTSDAKRLYQNASRTKAVDSTGELPELTTESKLRPYDLRIIDQATRERQLRGPETFVK